MRYPWFDMTFFRPVFAIFIILTVHFIAVFGGIYEQVEWFDIPMHFAGGFAMGLLALAIWKEAIHEVRFKKTVLGRLQWWFIPLFCLGFVALIGIGWEWYEFIMDQFFVGAARHAEGFAHQPGLADTMMDFFFDLVGGTCAVFTFRKKYE